MTEKIENLIVRFLAKEANIDELRQLELWVNNPNNERLFLDYIKTNALINITMSKYDKKAAIKNILSQIKQEQRSINNKAKIRSTIKYAAAAVIIGIFVTTYFLKDNKIDKPIDSTPTVVKKIEPGTDKATLTLDDGSVVALEKGNTYKTQNANSNGEEIVYKTGEQNLAEIKYNYLTIPRGGQFHIVLSDGTEVWLNSESQLKYPVSFVEGETRQVELVYGEAYFDVSPSTKHQGSKFKVFNQFQEIEVSGTEFNVKAYKDESSIYTTLVEGKVSVSSKSGNQILKPTQQSILNLLNNTISVANVDVYNEISWKEGVFSFRKKSLGEIAKVLSRWYDVDIKFVDPEVRAKGFNGVIGKEQKLEDILDLIKSYKVINEYTRNDKMIILK